MEGKFLPSSLLKFIESSDMQDSIGLIQTRFTCDGTSGIMGFYVKKWYNFYQADKVRGSYVNDNGS